MNEQHFDDFLHQQLQGSSPYLDDGDFSARVMAGLPAPKRLNPWVERLIVCVPVTLIALLVLNQFSLRPLIQPLYAWVLTVDMRSLITLALAMAVVMVVIPLSIALRRTSLF
jgi:hypothetical protein